MVLIEKIDASLISNGKSNREGLHASEIAGCERKLYYDNVLKKPKSYEPRIMRVFDNGNHVHMRFMSMLFRVPDIRIVAAEIKMPKNDLVDGTADCIVGIGTENYLVDFKSIGSYGFQILNKPKREHVIQVLVYLYFFKLKKGLIIYENKDNQEMKEFVVDLEGNEKVIEQVLEKVKRLKIYIKNKTLPVKPVFAKEDAWACDYCCYKEECNLNLNVEAEK